MAIHATPIISNKIYLADLSDDVHALEGDCEKKDRAWVMVRQATEADNMRLAARGAESTIEWDNSGLVREKRSDNFRERWAYQVFMTLHDSGNILNPQGKNLFSFIDKQDYRQVKGGFKVFLEAFGSLPSVVTGAILTAIYKTNPDWDWRAASEEEDEESGEVKAEG